MSRTDDPLPRRKSILIPLIFCVLTGCLAAHFLVEDAAFLPAFTASEQASSASHLGFDEMEHQDDLAFQAMPAVSAVDSAAPLAFVQAIPQQSQYSAPILLPPKI